MTDLLEPAPGCRALEVGTGSGYQAAVLSRAVREGLHARDRRAARPAGTRAAGAARIQERRRAHRRRLLRLARGGPVRRDRRDGRRGAHPAAAAQAAQAGRSHGAAGRHAFHDAATRAGAQSSTTVASRHGRCCRSPSCRSPADMTDVAQQRPPLASVALLSSAVLATEILLTRSFAVVHWHHFAYMIISLALLGFGASGTFLALAHRGCCGISRRVTSATSRHSPSGHRQSGAGAGIAVPSRGAALGSVAAAVARADLPLLSTPFFCAANAIGLALIAFRDRAGRVYAADLVGAGLGSVVVLALLYWLWPESADARHRRRGPCRERASARVELRARTAVRVARSSARDLPRCVARSRSIPCDRLRSGSSPGPTRD